VAENVELAESVSIALMLVLETLSPIERVVFVLHEAFDVGYDEIAAAIDKSPAAARQTPTVPASTSMPAARARWSLPARVGRP
jgi:hypothetical protein